MIKKHGKLGFQLECQSPFIITMHHKDYFPKGNGKLGPIEKLESHGEGFDLEAPWRMYHGDDVPGFPAHPHRGFETVTIVTEGVVDHSDGLGSSGRYADGDVQWMSAGKGLQHAEMFPLVHTDKENTMELFQIWLSLYGENRMKEPDYKMLWREDIPVIVEENDAHAKTTIKLIAGHYKDYQAVPATSISYASDPSSHLSIQLIELEPNATHVIPGVSATLNRSLYFYEGDQLEIENTTLGHKEYVFTSGDGNTTLKNTGKETASILLLEAEPLPEPIVAYGPFVMSSQEGIRQAYADYQKTEFGGWPFESYEVYHDVNQARYAKYPDGRMEEPDKR